MAGLERDGASEVDDGGVELAGLEEDEAEVVVGVGVGRLKAEGFAVGAGGGVELAEGKVGVAEVDAGDGVVGAKRDGDRELGDGLGRTALGVEKSAEVVAGGGEGRMDLHGAPEADDGFGVASAMQRVRGALAIGGEAFDVTGRDRPVERPGTPAPPLVLVDQHAARFDLASMRGTPVLVTFAFAHCEVVCPTVVQEVRAARRDAGAARMPMVIVTLDPWRDVPTRLPHMARDWQLTEGDRVLSGTVEEVNAALDAWGVPRSRDAATGEVAHATVVLVVDSQGRIDARMQEGFYRLRSLLPAGPG